MKKLTYFAAAVILAVMFLFNAFAGGNDSSSNDMFTSTPVVEKPVTESPAVVDEPEIEMKQAPVYERANFGKSWQYMGNSCNMRQVVLAEKMENVTFKADSDCKVASGNFVDVFTGVNVVFSSDEPNAVPIDHIFSLSEAWNAGAWEWTFDERVAFANDIDNLTPTVQYINSWKSDRSLSEVYDCVNISALNCAPDQSFVGMNEFMSSYSHIADKYDLLLDARSTEILTTHGY